MAHILIVEDERDLADLLKENLEAEGHSAEVAAGVAEAWAYMSRRTPDLVVLDLMLPDGSGASLLKRARAHAYGGPVLILSARSEERTKVQGFRAGADDYVTKPFGLLEFLARINALLRRAPATPLAEAVHLGVVEVRPRARKVFRDGRELALRPREMDLLLALLSRPNEAVSRRDLLVDVWGYSPQARTRTIDWHVSELRRKIEADPRQPELIRTVPSVGYRLDLPTE